MSVQGKLAGSVAHYFSTLLPLTNRDKRTGDLVLQPAEFRAYNLAASIAVPMNTDDRVKDICLALCSHLKNLSPCNARKLMSVYPHPVVDAVSNAKLWLSMHSDIDLRLIRATYLVASPARFGLDVSMGIALLRSIEVTRPWVGYCRNGGDGAGMTRMLHVLFIWRELFTTDGAVDAVVGCLRHVFPRRDTAQLSLWDSPDPTARLAHILASTIHSGVQCYCLCDRTTRDAAVQHLLWLLAGSESGASSRGRVVLSQLWPDGRRVCPDAVQAVKDIVGSPAFLRPTYAYPALIALGVIGRRLRDCRRSPLSKALAQHCASYLEIVLRNALLVSDEAQLSSMLDCIVDFRIISNLAASLQHPDDKVRVFVVLSGYMLRPQCRQRHGDWFAGRVLFHGGYTSLSHPTAGSWRLRSLVGEIVCHLLAETRLRKRTAYNGFLGLLLSLARRDKATRDDVERLGGDVRDGFERFHASCKVPCVRTESNGGDAEADSDSARAVADALEAGFVCQTDSTLSMAEAQEDDRGAHRPSGTVLSHSCGTGRVAVCRSTPDHVSVDMSPSKLPEPELEPSEARDRREKV
ncbi:hypothetical protein AURDEDRAFT_125097 [Auricularia subglabra TFB-10046 SS5]|uniref:Uncharacterized protein n=1 Tax=Auricularia subglabra (strain TFB-10046 / SS5) TaxID=717982 RepID=J0DDI4_AURST|nr:hypothetical protein AURDEDRAFT_125097 [Auricularia subglabra TFB-10046 SS5]